MPVQSIKRSNGDAFCGHIVAVIAQAELDHDVSRDDGSSDDGPYRHTFELYAADRNDLIVVVTFFDHGDCRFRHGQRFRKLDSIRELLQRYDPCQHLPLAAAGDRNVRDSLVRRYANRRDRFLQEAERRTASEVRA